MVCCIACACVRFVSLSTFPFKNRLQTRVAGQLEGNQDKILHALPRSEGRLALLEVMLPVSHRVFVEAKVPSVPKCGCLSYSPLFCLSWGLHMYMQC